MLLRPVTALGEVDSLTSLPIINQASGKYFKNPYTKMPWTCSQLAIEQFVHRKHLSRLMGKPTIYICENKGADQLRGNREADQRLCFRYSDTTIPPLLNSKISNF